MSIPTMETANGREAFPEGTRRQAQRRSTTEGDRRGQGTRGTYTEVAIKTLVSIAKNKKATDAARVSACIALLDRGWGKPDKTHHHEGDIRQHIISDRPLTADEWRDKYCRA
jgi:hypothetical protein